MRVLVIFVLITVAQGIHLSPAIAQEVINKSGNKCPTGYRDGKGAYCYRASSYSQDKVVEKADGSCPSGYRNGKGAYCYGRSSSESVIVKEGGKCPTGYRNGPGKYCYPRH